MGRAKRTDPWFGARENGIYYAFWYDEKTRQTRRKSLETRDHAEARKQFGKFLVEDGQRAETASYAGVTVEKALDWYDVGIPGGDVRGHIEEKVVAKDRQRIAIAHLKEHFKDTPMKDVSVAASQAYARARREGKVGGGKRSHSKIGGDATIRRELNVLIAAANFCVHHDLMHAQEMPRVDLPAEVRERAPWLSKAAVATLFAKSDGKLRAFCRLAYYWGARRASIEYLKKAQVDLQHSRVDLQPPGAKRTKKRKPIVPIYPEVRSDIELLMDISDTEYLFGTPRDFYRDFVELCAAHGVKAVDAPDGKDPWPHLLRHSRATHMLMDGEDIYKVARLLGDTVATVERVYGHHAPEFLATKSTIEEVA